MVYGYFFYPFLSLLFSFLSFSAILCGFLVMFMEQTVYAILALAGSFLAITFLFVLNGFEYIGLAYLIVYIGAILILFLFVIMLIDPTEPNLASNKPRYTLPVLAIIVCSETLFLQPQFLPAYFPIKYMALQQWVDIPLRLTILVDPIVPFSVVFYNTYFYYLVLIGLLLLLTLLGVVLVLRFSFNQQLHTAMVFAKETRLKLVRELGLIRVGREHSL